MAFENSKKLGFDKLEQIAGGFTLTISEDKRTLTLGVEASDRANPLGSFEALKAKIQENLHTGVTLSANDYSYIQSQFIANGAAVYNGTYNTITVSLTGNKEAGSDQVESISFS